ncbi:fimbrillin family protein, partial [Phocaeicola vulgatus]|uniref:fimbrillin family protein n=1 Tax=Phocaeicola vulgatus TaxID=821 RepID=UPI000FF2BAF6
MKTRIMISAAVIAAGMLASCSNKEIVDEQPETDGVSASVLNIVPTVGTDCNLQIFLCLFLEKLNMP